MYGTNKRRLLPMYANSFATESERKRPKRKNPVMAADLGNGEIHLMKAYDDLSPIVIKTGMTGN